MKEELQDKLVEILGSIQTAAGKASDFALDQLPDIAQSYVAYGRGISLFYLISGVALLILVVYATYRFIRWMSTTNNWDASPILIGCFAGIIGLVMLVGSSVKFAALVWLAPKVWLLKEIAGMLK